MSKREKKSKAILETNGVLVSGCIIIRKNKNGKFYYLTVSTNGNYLDKALALSDTIRQCKARIRKTINFWYKQAGITNWFPSVGVYFDYVGAKVKYGLIGDKK